MPSIDPRVLVSYSAPQSLLVSSQWTQLHAALLTQLPLRNLHWRSSTRTSIRTIQELDIDLIHLDGFRDEFTSQVPGTVLDKPLVNLYFIACEDAEIETYRNILKKQLREWHATVTSRKNQEWLILQIITPDSRPQGGNFFQLKGSVIDKIRADFNTDKRERCFQLNWAASSDNPAAWAEFINKLKDGLISAFNSAVSSREEEVKRSESQRQMPGWNFCTFFLLKETLATSFEGVNLFEEAMLQYEELEASFSQVLKEENLSWFGSFINPGPKDDSAGLVSTTRKPYRDLILANTISIFDLRNYLLSRQCELLAKVGKLQEVCQKCVLFLGAFGRRLREEENALPPHWIESWIYSSALSVVERCREWISSRQPADPLLKMLNAGQGELLELARSQLDILGIRLNHLPDSIPFSMTIPSQHRDKETASELQISNSSLLATFSDSKAFYDLYITITNRAIEMYAKAGRRKFAVKLHGTLAALDVHRGRLDAALATYSSLPAHYAPHMWTSLESWMLARALDLYNSLAKPKDREWIHLSLLFLQAYVEGLGTQLLINDDVRTAYISQLVALISAAATELSTDLHHPDNHVLFLRVRPTARSAEEKDGTFIDIFVRNYLPCPFSVESIAIVLAGRDSEQLSFTGGATTFQPGENELSLFCPTPSWGTFLLHATEMRIGRLLLQGLHRNTLSSNGWLPGKESTQLVKIPQDLRAIDVSLHPSSEIELGQPANLVLSLQSGRNKLRMARVKLTSASVTFQMMDSTCDHAHFQKEEDCLVVTDVPDDARIFFSIPHSDASKFHSMKVDISVEYVSRSDPATARILHVARTIATTLPISVNVEDFFHGARLFSKFTISTTTHQHVRVLDAALTVEGNSQLKIVSCAGTGEPEVMTVTPSQPVNFIFYTDLENSSRQSLILKIRYRMLREEVEQILERTVAKLIQEFPDFRSSRLALIREFVTVLESDASWVTVYNVSGELVLPIAFDSAHPLYRPLQRLKETLSSHKHPNPPEEPWNELRIPVDLPNLNIIAGTRIELASASSEAYYAGQPIDATLTIHTSFKWDTDIEEGRSYMMQFDVDEMVQDWLVSGKKRGEFHAQDDATYTSHITLIALHHGELGLPKVNVTALPVIGEYAMGSLVIPSLETHQIHGAEVVLILPRGGRSTFVLGAEDAD